MASKRVLKFSSSNDESACVLIQVSSKGSKPLDLKLIGTEGEAPYVCSLRHDRVASLRVKNCPISESEWQDALLSLFNQEPLEDIQATADIQSESSISITVRKQVQGITQRLGAITLTHDPDEAIELFDWCAVSADAVSKSKEAAAKSATTLQTLEATVQDLKTQLDELVQAKRDDEVILLQKFRDLLNEKKVKIREQQKVIAESSSFTESAAAPSASAPSPSSSAAQPPPKRKAAASKPGKRKAKDATPGGTYDEDVDMLNTVKSEPEDTDPGNTTEATASASEDDDDEAADMVHSQQKPRQDPAPAHNQQKTQSKPPPPRNLPFQNKKPVTRAADDDSDSDDEL